LICSWFTKHTDKSMHPVTDFSGDPLVVRPEQARRLLACGRAALYEMINNGELDSYKDGAVRKITMESLRRFIERKLRESREQKVA
jgi:excisionase family DNA binding protein